jgi:putative flavoprotein involved in K+ transport
MLDAADAYVAREGLDLPEEPAARAVELDPACVTDPILKLDLRGAGIIAIVWATGFALGSAGGRSTRSTRAVHQFIGAVTELPGLYFLGLN